MKEGSRISHHQENGPGRWIASGLLLFLVFVGIRWAVNFAGADEAAAPASREATVAPSPKGTLSEQWEARKKRAGEREAAEKVVRQFNHKRLTPSPTPAPTPSPEPEASPSPVPTEAAVPIDLKAAARYRRDYAQASREALKKFDREQKSALSSAQAKRKADWKSWKKTEADLRHKFFAENPKGPDRRAYVQAFIARREEYLRLMREEEHRERHESDAARERYLAEQKNLLRENESYLEKGLRPPEHLWAK